MNVFIEIPDQTHAFLLNKSIHFFEAGKVCVELYMHIICLSHIIGITINSTKLTRMLLFFVYKNDLCFLRVSPSEK